MATPLPPSQRESWSLPASLARDLSRNILHVGSESSQPQVGLLLACPGNFTCLSTSSATSSKLLVFLRKCTWFRTSRTMLSNLTLKIALAPAMAQLPQTTAVAVGNLCRSLRGYGMWAPNSFRHWYPRCKGLPVQRP